MASRRQFLKDLNFQKPGKTRTSGKVKCDPPCVMVTILIELGHSCEAGKLAGVIPEEKIGHAAMAIGDDFFDFGPKVHISYPRKSRIAMVG